MAARLRPLSPATGLSSRVPPHNLEAEESILGACLLSREAIANVLEVVTSQDFYKPAHAEIFTTVLELYGRGEPVDAVTLAEELRRKDLLEPIGGMPYLHTLVSSVPTAGSATHYARIVEENALLRRLIEASQTISEIAFSVPEDVEDAVDQAENLVYQVSQRRLSQDFTQLSDLLTENMELIEKLSERGSSITGLPSGFTELDNLTAGFQPSNLIIVAARPSQGKSSFAISVAQHVAVTAQIPVVIFSLEMSKMELVQRLICSEARIDSNRLRRGALSDSDWPKLSHALGRLAEAPIFIDDTPNVNIMELRAKCRRLKSRHGLGLVIVDYLQLMQPIRRTENRVQEVTEISRSIKILARELEIPVLAVSQLSRNVEYRADKRPVLADLRESGCLSGDTLIPLADTGERVPIRDLVGESGIAVWALDPETLRIERAMASRAFPTGTKLLFRLTTGLGRTIRATANHRFLTASGWKRLDQLGLGERMALPRRLPSLSSQTMSDAEIGLLGHLIGDGCTLPRHAMQYTTRDPELAAEVARLASCAFGKEVAPRIREERRWLQVYLAAGHRLTHGKRNAIAVWLDSLGVWGLRSYEKRVPEVLFAQPAAAIARFLRHLWATDGCIGMRRGKSPYPNVYYATSSAGLARDVQSLLLRLDINARVARISQGGKGRDQYHVIVSGKPELLRFVLLVGTVGAERDRGLQAILHYVEGRPENTNRDVIPVEAWRGPVRKSAAEAGITHRELHKDLGMAYAGMTLFKQNLSRERAHRVATAAGCEEVLKLAESDVYWDRISAIEPDGIEEAFDLTVPGPHNFVADDVIAHNSLEQDSDLVLFIYRDEVYNQDSAQKGIAEIHLSKHRNGPIGKIELAFLEHYTKFANLARGV